MPISRDLLDFSAFRSEGRGSSDFGHAHGPGVKLKPDLPFESFNVTPIDLTHQIDASEVGRSGKVDAAKGGGTGGGTSFQPYVAGAVGAYNIKVDFLGSNWTQSYYDQFVQAANKLVAIIVQDLPNVTVRSRTGSQVVDDIVITAELARIDGVGRVLGQAGPTAIRTDSSLPATAQMKFDIADVANMSATEFGYVVLHEMAHSLGFGSIWTQKGLVSNGFYTGQYANAEFQALGGVGPIPVEQDGGGGTAGSHWDEETFTNELMTGYIDAGRNYFTKMSAAAFRDMGYGVNTAYPGTDSDYFFG